jgi:hypothetical protein
MQINNGKSDNKHKLRKRKTESESAYLCMYSFYALWDVFKQRGEKTKGVHEKNECLKEKEKEGQSTNIHTPQRYERRI